MVTIWLMMMFLMGINGGFHSHGGTPKKIDGLFHRQSHLNGMITPIYGNPQMMDCPEDMKSPSCFKDLQRKHEKHPSVIISSHVMPSWIIELFFCYHLLHQLIHPKFRTRKNILKLYGLVLLDVDGCLDLQVPKGRIFMENSGEKPSQGPAPG